MTQSHKTDLEKLDNLATLLDSRYRVPFTPIRFGLDSLLGLIPGVGDLAALGPSAYLVYRGYKMGARKRAMARMALNTGLDFFVGAVPILGDVFDLVFKANNRNFDILRTEIKLKQLSDLP